VSAIREAKAVHFMQAMADAASKRTEIWPLAKWANEQSYFLQFSQVSQISNTDLSNIHNASCLAALPSPTVFSEKKITSITKKLHPL
jgi:hypothetical protein